MWIGKHWDSSALPKFERLTRDGQPSGETRWIRAKDLVFLGMTWDPEWKGLFGAPMKTSIEILSPPAEHMLRLVDGSQVLNLTAGAWMESEDPAFEGSGYFLVMKRGSCELVHHFPVGQVVYGEDVAGYGSSVFTEVNAEGAKMTFRSHKLWTVLNWPSWAQNGIRIGAILALLQWRLPTQPSQVGPWNSCMMWPKIRLKRPSLRPSILPFLCPMSAWASNG